MNIKVITQDECSPCQMVKNYLNKNDVEFEEVNIGGNFDLADEYNVMSTPVTILFEDDEEVARIIGFNPSDLDVFISQL